MECAKCGKKFFQHSPVNALWCDTQSIFLCRKCTTPTAPKAARRCPLCSGPVSAALSIGFPIALFFLAFLLVFGFLVLQENDFRAALESTPEVAVSAIQPGEHVRLYGWISSTHNPVLSAFYTANAKGGGYWTWSGYDFSLVQGNSSVLIEIGGMFGNIYGTPPEFHGSGEEYYYNGDYIAIVGTVVSSGGGLAVHAEAAASSPTGFASPGDLDFAIAPSGSRPRPGDLRCMPTSGLSCGHVSMPRGCASPGCSTIGSPNRLRDTDPPRIRCPIARAPHAGVIDKRRSAPRSSRRDGRVERAPEGPRARDHGRLEGQPGRRRNRGAFVSRLRRQRARPSRLLRGRRPPSPVR
ncbi:MAG: hypothetical protein L3K09_01310 [Thermoplasmata archaeon]|nr:hypothetical protein [Thermoplasmata archaeon]